MKQWEVNSVQATVVIHPAIESLSKWKQRTSAVCNWNPDHIAIISSYIVSHCGCQAASFNLVYSIIIPYIIYLTSTVAHFHTNIPTHTRMHAWMQTYTCTHTHTHTHTQSQRRKFSSSGFPVEHFPTGRWKVLRLQLSVCAADEWNKNVRSCVTSK